MTRYMIQVLANEWAGTLRDGWRPGVDGTLNNTNMSPEEASTFDTRADAERFLRDFVVPEGPTDSRIVEVA